MTYILDLAYRLTRTGSLEHSVQQTDALIEDCLRHYVQTAPDGGNVVTQEGSPVRDRQFLLEGTTPQTRTTLRLALRRLDIKWDRISMTPEKKL